MYPSTASGLPPLKGRQNPSVSLRLPPPFDKGGYTRFKIHLHSSLFTLRRLRRTKTPALICITHFKAGADFFMCSIRLKLAGAAFLVVAFLNFADYRLRVNSELSVIIRQRSLYSLLGKHAAMNLNRRQTVKRFHNRFVGKL